MSKYVRLLRLGDQSVLAIVGIAPGVVLAIRDFSILWWTLACVCASIASFVLNEVVDREDADQWSWNKVHVRKGDILVHAVVAVLFVTFSVLSLFLGYLTGLFWLMLIIYVLAILYSLRPIRLKGRFGLDIAAQFLALALAFLGPFFLFGRVSYGFFLILVFGPVLWGCLWPYQLADWVADVKAGLRPTHVVIGMDKSLWLGLGWVAAGTSMYLVNKVWTVMPWTLILVPFVAYALGNYIYWLRLKKENERINSLQGYSRLMRRFSVILLPYLAWLWLAGV